MKEWRYDINGESPFVMDGLHSTRLNAGRGTWLCHQFTGSVLCRKTQRCGVGGEQSRSEFIAWLGNFKDWFFRAKRCRRTRAKRVKNRASPMGAGIAPGQTIFMAGKMLKEEAKKYSKNKWAGAGNDDI